MRFFGQLLQRSGLAIPLLAIIAQLIHAISVGQMLMFLLAAALAFWIGRILEGYAGH